MFGLYCSVLYFCAIKLIKRTKTMTKQEFTSKSEAMINDIKAMIQGGKLTILGKSYNVDHVGKHHIRLSGKNGGKYTLVSAPNCYVIETKKYGTYYLTNSTSSLVFDFTIFDGFTVELHQA